MFSALLLAASVQIPVIVHFQNWSGKDEFRNTIAADGLTHPLRGNGGYSSIDEKIIKEQNQEMLQNGLVPAISWWARKGEPLDYSGDSFWDTYLKIPSPLQCLLLYEVTARLITRPIIDPEGTPREAYDFDDPVNVARFQSDMVYLYTRYFSRPEYRDRFFLIDGKPVVFVWLSHAFMGNFEKASKGISIRDKIYIIGSNFAVTGGTPAEGDTSIIGGLDAVSAYGIYDSKLAQQRARMETDRTSQFYGRMVGHVDAEYVAEWDHRIGLWSLWISRWAPHVDLIPPIMYAFDNGKNFPLTSTYAEAEYFAHRARTVIDNSEEYHRNIRRRLILAVSFNEHYEGSSLEPTVEYGSSFLDITRRTFQEGK
jgi:hypothetical protein